MLKVRKTSRNLSCSVISSFFLGFGVSKSAHSFFCIVGLSTCIIKSNGAHCTMKNEKWIISVILQVLKIHWFMCFDLSHWIMNYLPFTICVAANDLKSWWADFASNLCNLWYWKDPWQIWSLGGSKSAKYHINIIIVILCLTTRSYQWKIFHHPDTTAVLPECNNAEPSPTFPVRPA